MIVAYVLLLCGLTIYSYALIDPNITFFNHLIWSRFLETMLQLGYYHRDNSWLAYLTIISLLFFFNHLFVQYFKNIHPLKLSFMIGGILLLSYPFLSHDFLKYMFDAKILTFYHKNPYLFPPQTFTDDPWLRFLQWTHQSFRYGFVFLSLIVIPSAMAMGKFLLSFIFFKVMTMSFYILTVYFLNKMDKRWAIMFATHPLIIIEGLVNGHNDLITAALIVMGIYWLWKKRTVAGRVFLLLSLGIKYFSFPALFLTRNKSKINLLIFLYFLLLPFSLLLPIMGTLTGVEILPWYFINLLAFIPYYENHLSRLSLLFLGLLLSYYPFIRYGEWFKVGDFNMRHIIIVAFFGLNMLLLLYFRRNKSHVG